MLVWALAALHVALMLSFAMLYPAMYGYDEPQHVDMAYAYSKGHGVYDPGERWLAAGVRNGERGPSYPPSKPFSDHEVRARDQRMPFDGQGGDTPYRGSLPNQMVQHPPLYYLLGAAVLNFPGVSGMGYDRQIWLLRMLSVLMLAPLPLLAWAAARALLGPGQPASIAAVLPLAVPGLTRIGASVTNDALMVLVGSLLVYLLARVLAGDLRARTGALVGAVLLAGLLTKGFGLALPPVAAAAYLVAMLRHRRFPVMPAVLVAMLSAAGGLWWLRNLLLYGAVQPPGVGETAFSTILGPEQPGGTLTDFVPGFVDRLSSRLWGGIGLPEGPKLSSALTTSWSVAVVALVVVGVAIGVHGRWGRASLAVLTLPAVLTLLMVFAGAYSTYRHHVGVYGGIHGRYLYDGLAGLAIALGVGLDRLARLAGRHGPSLARRMPAAVLTAALLTQLVACKTVAGAWWAPSRANGLRAELGGALTGIARWSPFPAVPTYAPFVLAVGLAVLALVVAIAPSSGPGGQAPSMRQAS
ncbi:MAG TPA: DUF2142 domain-containing protein [Mycobacteriales bacterium]|nr:DUF2142 domain-containing protein [Mycobacteriales bacterium]